MGRGGVSLGKTVKGAGLDTLVPALDGSPDPNPKPLPSDLDQHPRQSLWLQFLQQTRDLHNEQRQRLGAMLAQGAESGPVNQRILIDEMKAVSRSDWLQIAQDRITDLRSAIARYTDAELGALSDLDKRLDLARDHHDRAAAQIADLRALFDTHLKRLSFDLVRVRESMASVLGRDLDQITTAFQLVIAQDNAAMDAVLTQAQDKASMADSEFVQAREAAKDQEQLTTLRLQLSAQMEAYETEFATRYTEYMNINGERQKAFEDLIGRDQHYSDVIHCNNDLYHRFLRQCHRSRIQLQQHRHDHRQRNQGLRLEIANILKHVQTLRRSIYNGRRDRSQTIAHMSFIVAQVRHRFQEQLCQVERILRLYGVVLGQGGGRPDLMLDRSRLQLVALRYERDRCLIEQTRLRTQLNTIFGPMASAQSVQSLLRINGH